jgi:Family of unknown function (DUF5670)
MLWTVFVILLILWLLGMLSAYTLGGLHTSVAGCSTGGADLSAAQWTAGCAIGRALAARSFLRPVAARGRHFQWGITSL